MVYFIHSFDFNTIGPMNRRELLRRVLFSTEQQHTDDEERSTSTTPAERERELLMWMSFPPIHRTLKFLGRREQCILDTHWNSPLLASSLHNLMLLPREFNHLWRRWPNSLLQLPIHRPLSSPHMCWPRYILLCYCALVPIKLLIDVILAKITLP